MLLLQVNELQLHGTTKHRVAALHSDGLGYSGHDWDSRGSTRWALHEAALRQDMVP